MLITFGANTFFFDHITYNNLKTCKYHADKMSYHIRLKHTERHVECVPKSLAIKQFRIDINN